MKDKSIAAKILLIAIGVISGLAYQQVGAEEGIVIPNGNFEEAGNDAILKPAGSLGLGLILGRPIEAAPLGSGPWGAASTGILNLIAPPTVRIDSGGSGDGKCVVGGLAVVQLLGSNYLANRARIFQTLDIGAEPYAIYTVEVEIDNGTPLSVDVLSKIGFGIALEAGGQTLALAEGPEGFAALSISILSGSKHRLRASFLVEDEVPAGNLGIQITVGGGTGFISAGVLPDFGIDNVTLKINRLQS